MVFSNIAIKHYLERALKPSCYPTLHPKWHYPLSPDSLVSFNGSWWCEACSHDASGEEIKVDEELHSIVNALGGRLTELELLVQKMKMHMSAKSKMCFTFG